MIDLIVVLIIKGVVIQQFCFQEQEVLKETAAWEKEDLERIVCIFHFHKIYIYFSLLLVTKSSKFCVYLGTTTGKNRQFRRN